MINLLPYDVKRQTRAARINVVLFRLLIILGFSAIYLVLACYVTYFIINSEKTTSVKPVNSSPSSSTQVQSDTFRTNLAMSKNILDQQVVYSSIITGIASTLPTGTVIILYH